MLDPANIDRFTGRLRAMRDGYRAGAIGMREIAPRVRAWIAHAQHADTWWLRETIFRGEAFRPPRRPAPPS